VTYEEHIAALAREHEVVVHRDDDYEPQADLIGFEVWIKDDLADPFNYLIALHELGHIVAPRRDDDDFVVEWAAWEWAYAQALPVSRRALRRTWTHGLATYWDDHEELDPSQLRGKRC
jgi:hypothetical protein